MKQPSSENCPEPTLLIEFLQGKLEPPELDHCEDHLEKCAHCHETLRGLDSGDTLSEKVAAALIADHPSQDSDSRQIDGLIKRLTSPEFQTRNPAAVQAATSEIMADRAAEVLRCVQPDDETLGVLGDYALLRLIGSGSTGVVFQALDRTLERTVALKVLRPSLGVVARERFLAEARSAASIEHANVVTIFQVGQVGRLAFIAMQWLPGQTLETKLQSGNVFNESEVTDTILKVAKGLAAAHQKQLVHRDIKPANLWICDTDEQIKILDFGLARISDDNPGLTATGMLAGTPNFMSPEQARGLELDGRSDLFSVGCLMYQLLTGRLPFGASTILATLQSVQNQSPIPPRNIKPEVPQHLSDLTMCLLEKQPANRPESAGQLAEMLSSPREDWPIAVNQYVGAAEVEVEVARVATAKVPSKSGGMRWLIAGLLIGLAGWGAWLWSPQIVRVMTDQGEIVIESKVDDVEIQVFADGKLIRVVDTQTQQSFDLKSGKYTFAAQSSGNQKNTFAISPNQLTMSRGIKQVVKVKALESREPTVSPMNDLDKPVFQNRTFEHWLQVARRDRDTATRTDALKACAATVETKAEFESLITLSRKLCRKHGSNVIGNNAESDLYYRALVKVVNSLDTDQIVEFIETEIAEGTEQSRKFCSAWLARGASDPFVPSDWISKAKSVNQRAGQLGEALASHLEKPGNSWILISLVDTANKEKLTGTALAKALKRLAADPAQRLLLHKSIVLLLSDVDVFTLYRDDLLDVKTHPATRMRLFDTVFNNSGQNRPLPRQRQQLLFDLADGVLQPGDQRLEFAREFVTSVQDVLAEEIVARVLIELNRFDQKFDAQFKTETLLPRLQKLKKAVIKPERATDFTGKAKILLADIEYMIKKNSGDAGVRMPPGGFLKNGTYSLDLRGGGSRGGGMF